MRKKYEVTLTKIPAFVKKIAKSIHGGDVIALIGPLGAGKTTFTKALGKELGITKIMPSPTYVLMNQYTTKAKHTLYHLDVYRTSTIHEVVDLGITELWQKPENIVVIEWAEKIGKILPKETIYIYFK